MSADNGVYILQTVRTRRESPERPGRYTKCEPHHVYRVAHTQAVDNFEYYQENEPHNLGAYMQQVWGNSPVFESHEKALLHASGIAKEVTDSGFPLEYGVSTIETDLKFFGDH